jgi:hypothetical protein
MSRHYKTIFLHETRRLNGCAQYRPCEDHGSILMQTLTGACEPQYIAVIQLRRIS